MQLFRNRPLAVCCLIFITTLALAANTDGYTKLYLGIVAVFFLCLLLWQYGKRGGGLLRPACMIVILLSLLYGHLRFDRYFDKALAYHGAEATVCAEVHEITYIGEHAVGFTADSQTVNGEELHLRISVWAYTDMPPTIGDQVSFSATLTPVTASESSLPYLRAERVALLAEDVFDLTVSDTPRSAVNRLRLTFSNLQTALCSRISSCVEGEGGALMNALLLGNRDQISDTTERDFRRAGLSHVLSLSGLHLGLLTLAVASLCRKLHLPKPITLLMQCALVLLYMALTGLSLSITRAGLMTLLFSLSFFIGRENDGITSLSLAAVAIALISPYAVYDYGYWLSVIATMGILIRNEWHRGRAWQPAETLPLRLLHRAANLLGVTVAATVATLPFSAIFFGELSLIGPISNMLLLPLFDLYLLMSVCMLLLGGIPFICQIASAFGNLLLLLVRWISSLRFIVISVHYAAIIILLCICGAVLLLCLSLPRISKRQIKRIGAGCAAVLLLCTVGFQIYHYQVSGVYYTYRGSNEMLLVQNDSRAVLCDFSTGSYTAQKNGLAAARAAHITELDGYLISHYHTRYADSFPRLCGQIYVRTLYLPTPQDEQEDAIYRTLVQSAKALDVAVVRYEPYEKLPFADIMIQPHANGQCSSAHPAVALSLRQGDRMLTYLGAGYHESDRAAAAASAVKNSDLLIIGIHGGKEESKPHYTAFSSTLTAVLLPYANRVPASLYAALDERVRLAREGEICYLPL